MRTILACAAVLSVGILAGCGDIRSTMSVAPDRQGHASRDPTKGGTTIGNAPQADPKTEMWITLGSGDSLSSVAKAYGTTLDWLIKRNRLADMPKPGDNLIVPKPR